MKATVKVMNSYNYHNYSVEIEREVDSLHDIDDMRIEAQVLVDYAIKQKKEFDGHDNKLKWLQSNLSSMNKDLILCKERHGQPKPRSFFDTDDDQEKQPEFLDLSMKIHQLEVDIETTQFQIDNFKPFDYHDEEYRLAEEAGRG